MKRTARGVFLTFALAATADLAAAQGARRREPPAPADAASVESIVAAYYSAMSHAPGKTPDFERLRGIVLYVGMIVPPKTAAENFTVSDVDALADRYQKGKETSAAGLIEKEIARRIDCFGSVCHVFSTYEARHTESDARPFERGIRSLQLLRDGKRWWIASVTWDVEKPDNPIPSQYLESAAR
ncbi:MAG TPA: hypothetical protein VE007_13610 [Thermoanaerobaculia bacterium]|nr:hypothetical protein [Thermoanaerobaculia bacterium]